MSGFFKCFSSKTKPQNTNGPKPEKKNNVVGNKPDDDDQSNFSASQSSNLNAFHRKTPSNKNGPVDDRDDDGQDQFSMNDSRNAYSTGKQPRKLNKKGSKLEQGDFGNAAMEALSLNDELNAFPDSILC